MKLLVPILVTTLMATVGCKKKSDSETTSTSEDADVTLNVSSLAIDESALRLVTSSTKFSDLAVAASDGDEGLSSFKVYFRSIQLCESMTVSGTGYSNTKNCVDIYSNNDDEYKGTEAPTAAERSVMEKAGEGKFYDLLSSDDLSTLNQPVKVKAGKYNYGIIEVHPWVKIKAKSGSLCSIATNSAEDFSTGGDGIKTYFTETDSLTCGSAEETLVYITNANSNFRFLAPFTVSKGDKVSLDLAVDLNQLVKVIADDTSFSSGNLKANDGNNGFYIPMIRMGPAPRKEGETTKVETYTMGTASSQEQIRINLYYNSADSDRSIIAVNSMILGTAASTASKANKAISTQAVSVDGDTVIIKDWQSTEVVRFTRGEAGTATFNCPSSTGPSPLAGCDSQTSFQVSYEAPVTSEL